MITIIDPQKHISCLLSKPEKHNWTMYRLMRYVLKVDCGNDVVLHNVITGQLVVLNESEKQLLNEERVSLSQDVEELIDAYFFVPDGFDEHMLVINLRKILRTLDAAKEVPVTQYKILPTTACNARCYYCFEHGLKTVTMSEKTAEDVIEYIVSHCGNKRINITWFGGEPTIAVNRIDQISRGLLERGISYQSDMVSNGYLFDRETVKRAKELWNLKSIMISLDGTEESHNKTKAFINPGISPYKRILDNVGLLIEQGIFVNLRMNFDLGNYLEFQDILEEASNRFHNSSYIQVFAYPIIGEYANSEGNILHGSDSWFAEKVIELNNDARNIGLYRYKKDLPILSFIGCEADRRDAIVINPEGCLCRCGEQVSNDDSIGTINEGVVNKKLANSWKALGDYDACKGCVFFPKCLRMANCASKDSCYVQDRNYQFVYAVKEKYTDWKNNNKKGGNYHEI